MSAVFLDFGSVTRGDMDCTALEQTISPWRYYNETDADQVAERINDAEVVVCNKFSLNQEIIASARRLKLICIAATGYNNIDLVTAAERNVPVCNVRGYATPSVVQHVFMLMLNLSCNFEEYRQLVKNGQWQASNHFCPLDYSIQELSGKVLGIIGYGELGKAVSEIAKVFGMQVLIAEHKDKSVRPGRMAFDEVFRQADFITLHCPLLKETRNLISRRELNLMKSSAYLINTARGAVVNEADLLDSLSAGQIAGAGLDVLQKEPPANDNPLLQYQQPNLIITPHVAWASKESRQRLLNQIADNIRNFYHNKPFNQIMDAVTKKADEH
ncbi:2-hydroxyacid dehydrogenase [Nitrosomonas sp.]|uniref:2-hydroxyacid dehydrogenase n=1 Tax=Nitrosomonas sp. TaxID=42353 RepID=UPI00207F68DC|nr:2-hydroxyacid dehydrogenase [Nitrosomonas sp.]GJL76145.1 MAG: glycerate dehydrogenase [Nitrosomonas sp.]